MKTIWIALLLSLAAATAWGGARFDHAAHDANVDAGVCTPCHTPEDASIVPDKSRCKECHDEAFVATVEIPGQATHGPTWTLNHGPDAKAPGADCASCHGPEVCADCHNAGFADEEAAGMASAHRSDFHVTHPLLARADPKRCEACHDNGFCLDCHATFNPADLAFSSHRRGWSDLTVGDSGPAHSAFQPSQCQTCHIDSVLPAHEWSSSHSREARKNLATCQACHPEGDICLNCHSARTGLGINPHPADWNDIANRLKSASDGKTCRKCH